MSDVTFTIEGRTNNGYLALPASGSGPAVLLMHAWWGLNGFFKQVCDRLAEDGFVAFAPDLNFGKVVDTPEAAQAMMDCRDFQANAATVKDSLAYVRSLPQTRPGPLGVMGYSMGANWAVWLSTLDPEAVAAVVMYYGIGGGELKKSRAAYMGHFAEMDEWEPLEGVRQLEAGLEEAGREVAFYVYPLVGHWFVEENRPDVYDPLAAGLAWKRTLTFLQHYLAL